MTRHIFPAGTYYVGDLCYAVSDDDWSKLIDDTGCFGLNSSKVVDVEKFDDGVFYHQNKKCFIAGTKHGDGSYFDRNNEVYYVDSGSLGVMPLDVCNGTSMNGGQTHTFKEEFEVWENDGNLHFDNNCIVTNNDDEDEYEEQEDSLCEDCGYFFEDCECEDRE